MNTKSLNRLEGLGLIVILGSFLWQLIETDLRNVEQETEYYRLHEKIDNFWSVYANDYANRNPTSGVLTRTDFKYIFDKWKIYSESLKENRELSSQIQISTWIRVVLFVIGSVLLIIPKFQKMSLASEPKRTWKRLSFDESILANLTPRERAEVETERDLAKPVQQLLCDVHEETHNSNRSAEENIASAQKRMVSLMARVAMSSDRSAKIMTCLTWAIAIMTLAIVILTIVLVVKG